MTVATGTFAEHLSVEKMPAHWLMARLGKRVLRPGGREATRWLIDRLDIDASSNVVELAPGLGVTAEALIAQGPRSYVGVEREADAVAAARIALERTAHPAARIVRGDATRVPLPDAVASVVMGEAVLSMHPLERKRLILAEAFRLLVPGGRYAVHELAVVPDDVDDVRLARIQRDLSASIHVGVRIGTVSEWCRWLEDAGFEIEAVTKKPMRLLELGRLIADEGVAGTARFAWNSVRTPGALRRLQEVRATFRVHEAHLGAVALVARRPGQAAGRDATPGQPAAV